MVEDNLHLFDVRNGSNEALVCTRIKKSVRAVCHCTCPLRVIINMEKEEINSALHTAAKFDDYDKTATGEEENISVPLLSSEN